MATTPRVRRPPTRRVHFNEAAVQRSLYSRNPNRYQKTVKTNVGKVRTIDHAKLRADTVKLRKKSAVAKGKQIARNEKNAKKAALAAQKAAARQQAVRSTNSSTINQDHENIRRSVFVASVNNAYRKRVMSIPGSVRRASTYRFGE